MQLSNYGKLYSNFSLKKYNTYNINGKCKYFIIVNDIIKLQNLIKYLNDSNEKYYVIGNGSNIIIPAYYDGVVIKLDFKDLLISNSNIECGSSIVLGALAYETVKRELKGLEWAAGIPGTVAGAIINNAGAYGDDIMSHITQLEILENNKIKLIKKSDIDYGYRYTSLKHKNIVIIKAYLKLKKSNKDELLEIIKEYSVKRSTSQPLESHTAGSVFRNPEGNYAAKLIEDCGLKGYAINGAMVSTKHANFIVNSQKATSKDIINLINYIKTEVYNKYNIELVVEQEIIN